MAVGWAVPYLAHSYRGGYMPDQITVIDGKVKVVKTVIIEEEKEYSKEEIKAYILNCEAQIENLKNIVLEKKALLEYLPK